MDSIAPNIFVHDMRATIQYYEGLGFNTIMVNPEEGDPIWVMMTCGKVAIMFQTFESLGTEIPEISRQTGGSLLLYIQTNAIQNLYDKIKDKAIVIRELEKTFYGATEFSIQDNNGFVLTFAEHST